MFFEPPEVGAEVSKDQPYAEVESVKAVSDVYAPLSGEVIAVNEALADSPERINEEPYGEGGRVRLPSEGRGCSTSRIASCWRAARRRRCRALTAD